ncbi:MAG: type II CAAX prenyl endopeptidase Rce1 family protein [Promethearchaeota archaeon]
MVKLIEKYPTFFFFAFALFIAWIFWIPMALHTLEIINFPLPIIIGQFLGTLSVLASLFILEKLTHKQITLDSIFQKIQFKKDAKILVWLVIAACLLPFFTISGNLIDRLIGWNESFIIIKPEVLTELGITIIFLMPITLIAGLLSSPVLEEPGWRGFAVERLHSNYNHIFGSIILGNLWWLWHIPINIANGIEITIFSYLSMIVFSFAIDTIYVLSDRNLLTAMIMHSSLIVQFSYMYYNEASFGKLIISIAVLCCLRIYYQKKEETGVRKRVETGKF